MDIDASLLECSDYEVIPSYKGKGRKIHLYGREKRAINELLFNVIRGYFDRSYEIDYNMYLKSAVDVAVKSHFSNRCRRVNLYMELSRVLIKQNNFKFTAIGLIRSNFDIKISGLLKRYKALG